MPLRRPPAGIPASAQPVPGYIPHISLFLPLGYLGGMQKILLPALLLLAACGETADTRITAQESQVAAKANADVEAAMAEAGAPAAVKTEQ